MVTGSWKASSVIKIDMVNPIPPKNPAPRICAHDNSPALWERPDRIAKKLAVTIPRGLPMNNPVKTPRLFGDCNSLIHLPVNTIPVFARAKSGMIKKATGLCKKC